MGKKITGTRWGMKHTYRIVRDVIYDQIQTVFSPTHNRKRKGDKGLVGWVECKVELV